MNINNIGNINSNNSKHDNHNNVDVYFKSEFYKAVDFLVVNNYLDKSKFNIDRAIERVNFYVEEHGERYLNIESFDSWDKKQLQDWITEIIMAYGVIGYNPITLEEQKQCINFYKNWRSQSMENQKIFNKNEMKQEVGHIYMCYDDFSQVYDFKFGATTNMAAQHHMLCQSSPLLKYGVIFEIPIDELFTLESKCIEAINSLKIKRVVINGEDTSTTISFEHPQISDVVNTVCFQPFKIQNEEQIVAKLTNICGKNSIISLEKIIKN